MIFYTFSQVTKAVLLMRYCYLPLYFLEHPQIINEKGVVNDKYKYIEADDLS